MEKINILGININILSKKQTLGKIEEFLAGEKQHQLITVNPEMILEAVSHDEEFFYILNKADLSLPDGMGLKMAGWFMGVNLTRVTGADLVKDILDLAQKQGRRISVFNWRHGLSSDDEIQQALTNKYLGLKILVISVDRQAVIPSDQLKRVQEFQPEIIFSTLGAPYQEKFIFHNLVKLPSAKLGLGVGGAFDFLTGKIKRAPRAMRRLGLEWLWRLIKQPRRWRRIYNAVIVFPLKFLIWRFKRKI